MKFPSLFTGLAALALASLASAADRTAAIYIQPVTQSPSAPAPLAEIRYDTAAVTSDAAEVTAYEAPDIPDGARLVRVGVYNPSTKIWESSTSVASVENFGKGYSPTLILSVDGKGDVFSAALKGVRIDAGQTRDFGPKALVLNTELGKQPELNKPVVLSPEGKNVEQEEKTFLQKYVYYPPLIYGRASEGYEDVFANGLSQVLVVDRYHGFDDDGWRRRSRQMIDYTTMKILKSRTLDSISAKYVLFLHLMI